jgi:hypothetical protein
MFLKWNDPMALTPEARFSQRVRDGLTDCGCNVERIENRVNLGIADMLLGVKDRFVAMELKVIKRGMKVPLRPHQVSFLTRHAAKGRPCFVLIKHERNTMHQGRIFLYHGKQAMDLATEGLNLEPLASWLDYGMPWPELTDWLSGERTR